MLVGNMALMLMKETVWFDKYKYDEAERLYEERNAKKSKGAGDSTATPKGSIAEEIAKTRQRIQNSLKNVSLKLDSEEATSVTQKVQNLESELDKINNRVNDLQSLMESVLDKVENVQKFLKSVGLTPPASVTETTVSSSSQKAPQKPAAKDDDDDDIDLFGSEDEEDEAAANLREQRLKAYESKKAKKAPVVAKSSVILDVKPWDDETDLKLMESKVREIQMDGLKWGASKLVPLAYGIQKLQIVAVVEDEKVSIDLLQETIQEIEDLVQSVDVAAFNKL